MGNQITGATSSYGDDDEKMALRLDLYAQRIILKEVKFNSSLTDSGKCEKLIIITSAVLNRLPFRLISYMDRRHKLFSDKYETFNAMDRALLVNTNPEILKESKLDEPNEFRKRQMCVGLARFYIQIGNLFNAIMTTMRPYNYENTRRTGPDNFSDMLIFSLMEGRSTNQKDKLRYELSNMSGFAKKQQDMKKRLGSILKFGEIVQDLTPGEGICNVQRDIEQTKVTPLTITGSSATETKIKPSIFSMLEELYYDIFHQSSSVNPKSPQFIAMTAAMKEKIYRNDVRELYRIVTGGKEPGPEIETFTDVAKYVNDNEEIKKWCNQPENKNMKIKVSDELRSDSGFVEYVQHIRDTIAYTSKQRKVIVGLLDRVFVTMKKSNDELREIEQTWFKSGAKKYEGFERDDEYSREFFKLNLKYDFFINPNLTDAELQTITNEARTRIVRLYADSYQRFLKGFQILQKIQANSEVIQLQMRQEISTKGQEEPEMKTPKDTDKNKSIIENINWDGTNLRDEKTTSETIQPILSEKSSEIASIFREMTSKIHSKGMNDDKYKQPSLFYLKKANAIVRPYLMRDQFNREVNENVKFQLSLLDKQFEGSMNQEKSNTNQQSSSFLTSIV
jgi:2-keto-4-pentenoate hydratase/2-oxohepta-3-ene-1,7-dioic acid hydratase in catechol pathway